jgi:hypothetical protein
MSTQPTSVSMNSAEFLRARELFRARIDSLDHDIKRCFWSISEPGAPGPAFFPPVMYCFATLDYFSSFWAGWNDTRHRPPGHSCNQTDRLIAFSERYLLYPRKESQIAIHFWRHKLMHTAEPRALVLRDPAVKESYIWSTGASRENHMRLVGTNDPAKFVLHFSPFVFVLDLREGIFGPTGYFPDLQSNSDLQSRYRTCVTEFESYEITIKP